MKIRPCKLCPSKRWGNVSWCRTHWFERKRAKQEATKAKRLERKMASKKFLASSHRGLTTRTWKLMSEWVRRSKADWRGFTTCYTCPLTLNWKELHAGHYQHGKLDFDERNIKPQCYKCNVYSGGRLDVYTLNLIKENSLEWVEQLKSDAAQHPGYTLDELKKIHSSLSERLNGMK